MTEETHPRCPTCGEPMEVIRWRRGGLRAGGQIDRPVWGCVNYGNCFKADKPRKMGLR